MATSVANASLCLAKPGSWKQQRALQDGRCGGLVAPARERAGTGTLLTAMTRREPQGKTRRTTCRIQGILEEAALLGKSRNQRIPGLARSFKNSLRLANRLNA